MAKSKSNAPAEGSGKSGTGSRGTGSRTYTHAEFTYVRRQRKLLAEEEHGELNIVPYLDIMVNLIMFLLVAQATMVSLGMIDVTAPSYSAAGPAGGGPEDARTNLRLTLGVASDGFYIAARGGVLDSESPEEAGELTPDGVTKRPPTVPKTPDGQYDYPGLSEKLRAIKTSFPQNVAVFLAADSDISYEVIVKTLDASRSDRLGELFPAVAFSRLR